MFTKLANTLQFGWRSRYFAASYPVWKQLRGAYVEPNEPKENLWASEKDAEKRVLLTQRAEALLQQYPLLSTFQATIGSRKRWLENLATLDTLDQLLPENIAIPEPTRWLDIGSKNGAYLPAIHAFCGTRLSTPLNHLLAVELDGYRLYADGYTRRDYAETYLKPLSHTQFRVDNLFNMTPETDGLFHVITWFLPFVFEDPLLAWGLPIKHFQPKDLLKHTLQLLAPHGVLLIVNQGEAESAEQQALFQTILEHSTQDVTLSSPHPLENALYPYQHTRIGLRCQKH